MSDTTTVYISETGASPFAVRIDTGSHIIIGDEAIADGGDNLGASPYQMLAAALGECTAMTVRWYARQQQWALEHVAVRITHEKAELEGRPHKTDIFRKTVDIRGPALTQEQVAKLVEIAAKCPVQRTLEGQPLITTATGPAFMD